MKLKILSEQEAMDLADRFPDWVSDLFRESAEGARKTIRWFIKTLYSKGYEIGKKNKEALEKIEGEELKNPVDEILTDEEKEQAALVRADKAIATAKKDLKDPRADWPKCPVCKIRPMAPWNKTGKCSYCQTYKKKKKD